MTNIKSLERYNEDVHEPVDDEVTYFSFIPFFEDELTYTMSAGRKQAFIRCAKWLFMCAGITDEEYREQVSVDTPDTDK